MAASSSSIWGYGPLQINFNSASEADTFRLHFSIRIDEKRAKLEVDFSPFEFVELLDDRFAELNGFEEFLTENNVSYSRSKNWVGHTTINCGSSSVTTFRERFDPDASRTANKRVVIPGEYIVSSAVSTGETGP